MFIGSVNDCEHKLVVVLLSAGNTISFVQYVLVWYIYLILLKPFTVSITERRCLAVYLGKVSCMHSKWTPPKGCYGMPLMCTPQDLCDWSTQWGPDHMALALLLLHTMTFTHLTDAFIQKLFNVVSVCAFVGITPVTLGSHAPRCTSLDTRRFYRLTCERHLYNVWLS